MVLYRALRRIVGCPQLNNSPDQQFEWILGMSDFGTYSTARAAAGRVRVPALGARCGQRPDMWQPARGNALGVRTATGPMPTVFEHAVRDRGTNPTTATKCHRLRPSECLM